MDNLKHSQAVLFLEECLNNRSKIVNHEKFSQFLLLFHKLCLVDSVRPVIRIRPNGEQCVVCSRYISGRNLNKTAEIYENCFICSVKCLREYKNRKCENPRKNTGDSCASLSTVDEESCLQRKPGDLCALF
jgi:hypothetical protein